MTISEYLEFTLLFGFLIMWSGLKYFGILVDLVPARKRVGNTNDHSLFKNKAQTWTQTNIQQHINMVSQSGRLDEIRAIKIWRNLHRLSFPSLYLELTVIDALYNKNKNQPAANVITVLEYLRDSFTRARVGDHATFMITQRKAISIMPNRKRIMSIVVSFFIGIFFVNGCSIIKDYKEMLIRKQLFSELKTVILENCTLKRFGEADDGGYLMCENLMKDVRSAYSYGIGGTDKWGCDVSKKYNLIVHQYDCFNTRRPVCAKGKFIFHEECVGDKYFISENKIFDSLSNQIIKNKDGKKKLVVKMDVEEAEWDTLLATPDEVLNNIDQLMVEFHRTNQEKYIKVFKKLKNIFYLVNVHYNNSACSDEIEPFPSSSYEVLFVNKRIGKPNKNEPVEHRISSLNSPNHWELKDCQTAPAAPTPEPAPTPAPVSAYDLFKKAMNLCHAGECTNPQKAIEYLNEAIRLEPNIWSAYAVRALTYEELEQYQLAIRDYDEAIRLKPDDDMVYISRAFAYGHLGQYQQAIFDFNIAIRLNPNKTSNYEALGLIYSFAGNREGECRSFKKACELGNCEKYQKYYCQ